MARITDSSLSRVRDGADFVAVVEERTRLRRQGAELLGLCPFHEERTPSFSVNPAKGLYHCHGCHRGGDLIRFVQDTQGVDFMGAVEWLGERFRIPLEYEEASPAEDARRRHRQRLYALLEDATSFYERYLWDSEAGRAPRDYLAGRGLGEEVCRAFRLGLAPGGSTLTRKAREKGFSAEELREAGLTRAHGGDYFDGRLVFPLTDARGRVVGFQARRLRDDDPLEAKYVNSAESPVFSRRAIVYGLDKARAAISREDRALLVEGNTDVIALHQAHVAAAVACMGTALTEQQLQELGKLTRRLWLAFDGDAAGEAATLRGMELAVARGFEVKVVALEPGRDPADDPSGFEQRLEAAEPYVLHRVRVAARQSSDRETGRRAAQEFLNGVPDSLDRRSAQRWANDHFGMPIQIRGGGTATVSAPPPARLAEAVDRLERGALAGVIAHPGLMPTLAAITPEHFRDPVHRRLRDHLVEGSTPTGEELTLFAELDALVPREGIDESTAMEHLLRLRLRELWEELQHAELEQQVELRAALAHIEDALERLPLEHPTAPA